MVVEREKAEARITAIIHDLSELTGMEVDEIGLSTRQRIGTRREARIVLALPHRFD